MIGSLLEFYSLATYVFISAGIPTRNSAHSCQFYSAAPLANQAAVIKTTYQSQSHYPDTEVALAKARIPNIQFANANVNANANASVINIGKASFHMSECKCECEYECECSKRIES